MICFVSRSRFNREEERTYVVIDNNILLILQAKYITFTFIDKLIDRRIDRYSLEFNRCKTT